MNRCAVCFGDVPAPHPQTTDGNNTYCWDCSYIEGRITEEKYLSCSGVLLNNAHATVRDGKVILWVGKKAPWDRKNKDYRNTPQYMNWRNSVYERDGFKCTACGVKGGRLNAHHIKPFATNVKERFEIDNGTTLCEPCHREVHRQMRSDAK